MGSTRSHWEEVYETKAETAVSWYQGHPTRSLAMIESVAPIRSVPIIDIGGGASRLVDDLLALGYSDLTVLDVAKSALAKATARIGSRATEVSWIAEDITQWTPRRQYQVWHDRAVFHFLTERGQQDAYITALKGGTRPGSTVIVATFDLDGPMQCSGLAVQRYDAQALAARFGPPFKLVDQAREIHRTPNGSDQPFSYAVMSREPT